jgi:hypothetical protein
VFNIVSAAIVLALTEWCWGRLITAGLWLLGAWAPIGKAAGLLGYHVSAHNVTAYTAGSSGATYFTAGTLCAAVLLKGAGRQRLLGLVGPLIAFVMWIGVNARSGIPLAPQGYGMPRAHWSDGYGPASGRRRKPADPSLARSDSPNHYQPAQDAERPDGR